MFYASPYGEIGLQLFLKRKAVTPPFEMSLYSKGCGSLVMLEQKLHSINLIDYIKRRKTLIPDTIGY
jgi:hypothetical protein